MCCFCRLIRFFSFPSSSPVLCSDGCYRCHLLFFGWFPSRRFFLATTALLLPCVLCVSCTQLWYSLKRFSDLEHFLVLFVVCLVFALHGVEMSVFWTCIRSNVSWINCKSKQIGKVEEKGFMDARAWALGTVSPSMVTFYMNFSIFWNVVQSCPYVYFAQQSIFHTANSSLTGLDTHTRTCTHTHKK